MTSNFAFTSFLYRTCCYCSLIFYYFLLMFNFISIYYLTFFFNFISNFFLVPFNVEFILCFFSIFYLIICCFHIVLNNSIVFRLYQFTQYCLFILFLINLYLVIFFNNIETGLFFNNFLINDFLTITIKSLILLISFLIFFQYTFFIYKNKTN